MSAPEGFLLLTLPNTTLTALGESQSGTLQLECITVQIPDASAAVDRDVYLILRINSIETPIDPARVIYRTDGSGWRTYNFQGTESDPNELVVTVSPPTPSEPNPLFLEDLETFESILAQYADLRGTADSVHVTNPIATVPAGSSDVIGSGFPGGHGDLRGHLVVVNEDTGEVIGQFDDGNFKVQEDPRLHEKGHENDAVIIEVPDTRSGEEQDATALQMFIRAVPPDQQDWLTKSATVVRYVPPVPPSIRGLTFHTAMLYHRRPTSSLPPLPPPPHTTYPTPRHPRTTPPGQTQHPEQAHHPLLAPSSSSPRSEPAKASQAYTPSAARPSRSAPRQCPWSTA